MSAILQKVAPPKEVPPGQAVSGVLARSIEAINREINRGFAKCVGAKSFSEFVNCIDSVFAANPPLLNTARALVLRSLAEMGLRYEKWEDLKRNARYVPYQYYAMSLGVPLQLQQQGGGQHFTSVA